MKVNRPSGANWSDQKRPSKRTPRPRLGQALEPLAVRRKDAARLLGVSEGALRLWEAERRGPVFVREGKAVLYSVARLRDWMEAHTTDPTTA